MELLREKLAVVRPYSAGRARVLALTRSGRELSARLVADVAALTPLRHLDAAQQHQLSDLLSALTATA